MSSQVTPDDVFEALALVADLRTIARELAALDDAEPPAAYAPEPSAASISSARSGGRPSYGVPSTFR
jgi:hypothetical protein